MLWWCDDYGGFLFVLGAILLVLAGIAAVVEIALRLKARMDVVRRAPTSEESLTKMRAENIDPVQLSEALARVLEAIKGLPGWIALFLAGLALVWFAGQRIEACSPAPPPQQGDGGDNSDSPPADNGQAPSEPGNVIG